MIDIHLLKIIRRSGGTLNKMYLKRDYALKICLTFTLVIVIVMFSSCRRVVEEQYPSGKKMTRKEYRGGKLDGIFRMWYEGGGLQQEAIYRNDKLEGRMLRFFGNGGKELEEYYVNGMRNGTSSLWDNMGNLLEVKSFRNDTLHGPFKAFFTSGMLNIEGSYESGFYQGHWSYYSENGIKVGEADFDRGSGLLKGYDMMGRKIREVEYRNNLKHGYETEYNTSGSVIGKILYENDKIVRIIQE